MRLTTVLTCTASILAASATFAAAGTADAAVQNAPQPANVSAFLAGQLSGLTGRTTVLVHGTSITAARQAVAATGMSTKGEYRSIGVVIANATKSQIAAVRTQSGVTYVEGGAQPIEFLVRIARRPTPPPAARRRPRRSAAPTAARSPARA